MARETHFIKNYQTSGESYGESAARYEAKANKGKDKARAENCRIAAALYDLDGNIRKAAQCYRQESKYHTDGEKKCYALVLAANRYAKLKDWEYFLTAWDCLFKSIEWQEPSKIELAIKRARDCEGKAAEQLAWQYNRARGNPEEQAKIRDQMLVAAPRSEAFVRRLISKKNGPQQEVLVLSRYSKVVLAPVFANSF